MGNRLNIQDLLFRRLVPYVAEYDVFIFFSSYLQFDDDNWMMHNVLITIIELDI